MTASDAGVDSGLVVGADSGAGDALSEDAGAVMCTVSFSGIAHGSGTCGLFGPTPELATGDVTWRFVGTKGADSNLHSSLFSWVVSIHGSYDVRTYHVHDLSEARAAIDVSSGAQVVHLSMTSTIQPARGDMTFALTSADGKHGTTDVTLTTTTAPAMMAGFHATF
jgi:hypothetical protein